MEMIRSLLVDKMDMKSTVPHSFVGKNKSGTDNTESTFC